MKTSLLPLIFLTFLAACQSSQPQTDTSSQTAITASQSHEERQAGGSCECCEAIYDGIPELLNWDVQISPSSEPGQRLEVSGTILKSDGKTPAEGVVLYVYHTDNNGLYSAGPKTSDCAMRHGHLRAWMKTGPDGRYRFSTIRPANYPGTEFEQHIHPVIKEDGVVPYWIDEFVFDDDTNLTEVAIAKHQNRGGSGIMKMTRRPDGTWLAKRDIFLGKNVPGY